jgi:hypothetical protein
MAPRKTLSFLKSVANAMRATVAGRRESDQVIRRVLRSDSDEPTAWRRATPTPDSKTPLCPTCGATMIHAEGERSANAEFWACSRLDCNGTREMAD